MVKEVRTGNAGQHAITLGQANLQAPIGRSKKKPVQSDQLTETGQGAPVVVAQEQQQTPIGRPKPQKPSKFQPLSKSQLKDIAKAGSVGLKGSGELKGQLELRRGKAVLITAGKGTRGEVRFTLDLSPSKAAALEGKTVTVQGNISKTGSYAGTIGAAKLVAQPTTVKVGEHLEIGGTVKSSVPAANGRSRPLVENEPEGSFVTLDTPIKVGGQLVKELHLFGEELATGDKAKLFGRLDKKEYGPEGNKTTYYELSGISNLAKGEPKFEDGKFTNAKGEVLERLSYDRPLMVDAPARLYVLDRASGTAYLGAEGGFIPPWINPFHGFSGSAKIADPTDADRAAARMNFPREGEPFATNAAGERLELISRPVEADPNQSDPMSTFHYLDVQNNVIYGFQVGGIGGFMGHMSDVIRLGQE